MRRKTVAMVLWIGVFAAPAAADVWFEGIGSAGAEVGEMPFSRINGLSADGSVAAGFSTSAAGGRAVRWTRAGGLQLLDSLPGGGNNDFAVGVSADGAIIVGHSASAVTPAGGIGEATVWNAAGASSAGYLAQTDFPQSSIAAISADNSTMVGSSSNVGVFEVEATRWVNGVPMSLGAGGGSGATAISADGSMIAGSKAGTNGAFLGGFLWTAQGLTELQDLASGGFFDTGCTALAMSSDGARIVGWATDTFAQRPAMWDTAGNVSDLGVPLGFDGGLANAITADGSVVVGRSFGPSGEAAFLWTDSTGAVNLNDYLSAFLGSQLDGWTLTSAEAVSADGLTFAGEGINPNGVVEGWVARIPGPGTASLLSLAALAGVRRRR